MFPGVESFPVPNVLQRMGEVPAGAGHTPCAKTQMDPFVKEGKVETVAAVPEAEILIPVPVTDQVYAFVPATGRML